MCTMLLPILIVAATHGHAFALSSAEKPMLMRHPTLSKTSIAFQFAGDIWAVPREGGEATRLTSSPGVEADPTFSPDGTMIAFAGQYDGNTDVFVIPAKGGEPKRLTYHPAPDTPVAWTPDGRNIIYVSSMRTENDLPRLFKVPVDGGVPEALPFPSGSATSFSPDGSKMAYMPGIQWEAAWKRYRGGQTSPIWIANMADSKVTEIPRRNSNDKNPMWVGDKIYFISDRGGNFTLYSYDTGSKAVKQLVKNDGFDLQSASADGDTIVYEQLGSLNLYDTKSGQSHPVQIEVNADFPEVRTQYKNVGAAVASASLSPSGARAVFEARGDIFTVPAAKGDIRNLTQSSDSCERYPAWSPDGKSIAYLSDAGGEYKLVVRPASGEGEGKSYVLGNSPAYYYKPDWSPDSTKLAYLDNHHVFWYLDLASGKNTKIDEMPYENPTYSGGPEWSPDSKWITYFRELDSHLNAVFLYSLDSGKAIQLTDGMSDAKHPIFDLNGKYLYFVAGTNTAGHAAWLDLSSYAALNTLSNVYVAVLRKDLPSPLEPQSDEEKTAAAAAEQKPAPATPEPFRIDLDAIGQRILALPLPAQNYVGLLHGTPGTFLAAAVGPVASVTSRASVTLIKYSSAERRATPFLSGFSQVSMSKGGDMMLVQTGPSWQIVSTMAPPAPGQGALSLAGMTTKVDPKAEWRQIYHEVWRIERDFLYDPHFHGQNLAALEKKYEPFLDGIMSRDDLNYLFTDMLGEISIGHMFINGGDIPGLEGVPGGLLGADYKLENGRYRFGRVYDGENWNPGMRAPLTQPGVNVKAGEYLLAVNGKDLKASDNIYEALEGMAMKQVRLKVGPNPDGAGSRDVTVVPVPDEGGLRHMAWVEDNRRKVDQLSGGKVGYAHIPDTNIGGWIFFNRYYYAQLGKEGMVIDERFNHGGQVDDYMVDMMNRPLMSMWTSRYGKDFTSPLSAIYGPKVLLINQYAGSGGDYFPWHFRKVGVGPLIGKRTWGGLVGILIFPALLDGGSVTAPNVAFYNPNGTWDVENHGVDPDIEVDLDPYLWRQGHDPQLERGVQEVLKRIASQPKPNIKKPAYQDKSKLPPPQ
jgi:tricorn protease